MFGRNYRLLINDLVDLAWDVRAGKCKNNGQLLTSLSFTLPCGSRKPRLKDIDVNYSIELRPLSNLRHTHRLAMLKSISVLDKELRSAFNSPFIRHVDVTLHSRDGIEFYATVAGRTAHRIRNYINIGYTNDTDSR